MRAVLKAQINKTDRNDARGIAQMMRVGLYRPVHVKTLRSQKLRMLLTHRKLLQSKAIAIDNDLRGTLRNFGLKLGMVGTVRFEARIRELVENLPDLAALIEPLLIVRRTLREQFCILHRRLLAIVRDDEVCRRLMTTPGVGPVVSLTYRAPQALLLPNWIAGFAGLAGFSVLYFGRVAREANDVRDLWRQLSRVYGEDWPGLPVGTLK
jgi:transposase